MEVWEKAMKLQVERKKVKSLSRVQLFATAWTPGQGWDQSREKHGNIYTTIRKTDIGNLLYDSGNSNQGSVAT